MADDRKLRLSNFSGRHLWLLLFWPIYGLSFWLLERIVPVAHYYPMYVRLDDWIPFCEWFVIPYTVWYGYLAAMHIYLLLADVPAFRRMMWFLIITFGTAVLIFLIYPTSQELRPETFPRDNLLTRFVAGYYSIDTNTNVCPSLHCVGSVAVAIAAFDTSKLRRSLWRSVILVTAVLICLSTVFIKQHSAVDVFWGLVLSLAGYLLVYRLPRWRKEGKRMKEYELVIEIQNLCPNNQMRDIFFEEVETDDPEGYVRDRIHGKKVELTTDRQVNGAVTVYVSCDGLTQKYIFTPI